MACNYIEDALNHDSNDMYDSNLDESTEADGADPLCSGLCHRLKLLHHKWKKDFSSRYNEV